MAGMPAGEKGALHMKRLITGVALVAALAISVAANASSGKRFLTGGAKLDGSFRFVVTGPVRDGGTAYVGVENDQSGNCDGDSGTVMVAGTKYDVVCAHFVAHSGDFNTGSPKNALRRTGMGAHTLSPASQATVLPAARTRSGGAPRRASPRLLPG